MPENQDKTSLTQIADNIAASLFDGMATSEDVVVVSGKEPEPGPNGEEPSVTFDPLENKLTNPRDSFITGDILSDILSPGRKESKRAKVQESPATEVATGTQETELVEEDDEEGKFSFLSSLYKDEVLLPFEDDTKIDSVKDLKELIKANKDDSFSKGKEEGVKELLDELPEPVKVLVDYSRKGGADIESIFTLLGRQQAAKTTDVESEAGQINTIKRYYEHLDWEEDEIESQINILKDAGPDRLKTQANKFKSKLDELDTAELKQRMNEQEELEKQSKLMQQTYITNLTNTLKAGSLGKIRLSKDDQKDIYAGLIEERYTSFNGAQTNRLGALLHKIQFQEPNFELLSKVLLLLSNEEAYNQKVIDSLRPEVVGEQVRKIKSEQNLTKSNAQESAAEKRTGVRRVGGLSNPFK